LPHRTSEGQPDIGPNEGIWEMTRAVPGVSPSLCGAWVDFDSGLICYEATQFELRQLRTHRDRLRPVSSEEYEDPSSGSPSAATASASSRRSKVRLLKE
jgi:hypothetical protein